MRSNDGKQRKVVRYSGSTEKQNIQWDDRGKPLYTSLLLLYYGNCLCENRNLDICVADIDARAVVVVSAAGKLRFRYTGTFYLAGKSFYPVGITTDSQANILTYDHHNGIHIIDHDGHFLRYIKDFGLPYPNALCVDSRDNLFVTDRFKGEMKKIQYYEYWTQSPFAGTETVYLKDTSCRKKTQLIITVCSYNVNFVLVFMQQIATFIKNIIFVHHLYSLFLSFYNLLIYTFQLLIYTCIFIHAIFFGIMVYLKA